VIACEALALRPVLFPPEGTFEWLNVVFTLVGGSFAASGLLAWRRRPDSRTGALMTATGFAFFVSPVIGQITSDLAQTVRALTTDWWVFFFATLILTLLTAGRLVSRFDRALVASYAAPLVVLQLAYMMSAPEDGYLLVAWPDADVAHVIDRIQRLLLMLSCGVTAVVVVLRWRRSPPPRRRALLPSIAGALVLLLFAALLLNDLVSGTRSQVLLWIAACSFVTVPAAFLAGQLQSRLARGGVADLFRAIGTLGRADLQPALARRLGDPGLIVAYRVPGADGYADADGRAVDLPAPGGECSVVPIERAGQPVAALVYDSALDSDPELVEAVSAAAAIALENAHLQTEAEQRLTELKASRERIVAAGDAERRRLERNLHDGAQQRLVGIALQLKLLEGSVRDDPAAEQQLAAVSNELSLSLAELRELARGMHPAVLEHGLPAALEALAIRAAVPTTVSCETRERLPERHELAFYFVASEALANIAKYARATSATIRLSRDRESARVTIDDDGVGGADAARGSGLRGLADRVEALDGRLLVSSPPGAGTTISAVLPCAW
jgi:signal transduction histidine kinase